MSDYPRSTGERKLAQTIGRTDNIINESDSCPVGWLKIGTDNQTADNGTSSVLVKFTYFIIMYGINRH